MGKGVAPIGPDSRNNTNLCNYLYGPFSVQYFLSRGRITGGRIKHFDSKVIHFSRILTIKYQIIYCHSKLHVCISTLMLFLVYFFILESTKEAETLILRVEVLVIWLCIALTRSA